MKRFILVLLFFVLVCSSVLAREMNGFVGADVNLGYSSLKSEITIMGISNESKTKSCSYDFRVGGSHYFNNSNLGLFFSLYLGGKDIYGEEDGVEVDSDDLDSYDVTDERVMDFGFSYKKNISNRLFYVANVGSFFAHSEEKDSGNKAEFRLLGLCAEPSMLFSLDESGRILLRYGVRLEVPLYTDLELNGVEVDVDLTGFRIYGFAGLSIGY
ncbi:MAG: hypothetical protein IJ831_08755 [Spirochaetales bacterium]|nr:hypothetical protein [Spirochaetales bacterium]